MWDLQRWWGIKEVRGLVQENIESYRTTCNAHSKLVGVGISKTKCCIVHLCTWNILVRTKYSVTQFSEWWRRNRFMFLHLCISNVLFILLVLFGRYWKLRDVKSLILKVFAKCDQTDTQCWCNTASWLVNWLRCRTWEVNVNKPRAVMV